MGTKKNKVYKVIFVLDSFLFGGAERQALYLANYLKKNTNWDILFLALNNVFDGAVKKNLEDLSISYFDLQFKFKSSHLGRIPEIIKLALSIRKYNPDILIPFTIRPNVNINALWQLTGAKVSFWNQRDKGLGFSLNRRDKIFLWALKNTVAYICNSESGLEMICKFEFTRKRFFHKIHNGSPQPKNVEDKLEWRRDNGIDNKSLVVTMVSNLTKYKDHITLLKAWKLFTEEFQGDNPNVVLILAGRKDDTFESLSEYAHENNLINSVKFLGEIDNIESLLSASDLAIHSSMSEGIPNVILEYMMSGIPVIASKIQGNIECLGEDYKHYFEKGNWEDLKKKICEMVYLDEISKQNIVRLNRMRAESLFSIERMGASYVNLFLKYLDK